VLTLTSSDGWERWLKFCRQFRQYSFHNQVMILSQRPEATWVAGYSSWKQLGRQVRRGECGIRILAPSWRPEPTVHDDTGEPIELDRVRCFRVVRVFDVSQTEGSELPRPLHQIDDGVRQVELDLLLSRAGEAGFSVEFWELRGDRNGDCSHTLRRIRIDRRLPPAQVVKTLAHELAHALLHGGDFAGSRALAELEAESVAYISCRDLGIDSSAYSFGYVASWAGGGQEAARAVATAGSRVIRAAGLIVDGAAAA
jgi:antirestriction protein ArdC